VYTEIPRDGRTVSNLTPVKPKYLEQRVICEPCGLALRNAYTALEKVKELLSPDSYSSRHLIRADTNLLSDRETPKKDEFSQTDTCVVLTSPVSKPIKTPIKQKLRNAYRVQKERSKMHNTLKCIVKDEMDTFSTFTNLRNFQKE
jgi:hypothetical protein